MNDKDNGLGANKYNFFPSNDTAVPFQKNIPFYKLIADNALSFPGKTAVSDNAGKLTYTELNNRINQFTRFLKGSNVLPGDRIAVAVERSVEMLIALIAVMKLGAVYIPIDPLFPQKRIDFMLTDSSAKLLITNSAFLDRFSRTSIEKIDLRSIREQVSGYPTEEVDYNFDSKSLAYIIYTSGSTGTPKGIAIEHHSLMNFLFSMSKVPGMSASDKLLAITTISFDISALELFLPLIAGAELLLADSETSKDGRALLKLLKSENITTMQATPSGWRMLLEAGWEGSLGLRILCGGEALSTDLADLLIPKCRELWNLYGPTETTIWSAVKKIENTAQPITIGRPIDNTQLYLLNEKLEVPATGEIGNIYIGGEGLAREYLNKPELTAEAFITSPFLERERIYKTGDLGKFTADGDLICLGRTDQQIKIRGHRVELGAIESELNKQGGVKESFVVAAERNSGEPGLIAFVIPDNTLRNYAKDPGRFEYAKEQIIRWTEGLREFLPDYMIPAYYVGLLNVPRLPNGKTDRKALAIQADEAQRTRRIYKEAESKTESLLSKIWASVLNIEKVGINDNFFDLGGNSLLATRFVAMLEKDHEITLAVTKLYQLPFIEKLASFLDGKEKPRPVNRNKKAKPGKDVAIVGMSGRFPGANNIDELWDVVSSGKETISFFSAAELDKHIPESIRTDPNYVKARGIIDNADQFDAAFFGMNHRMAEVMDPQQRVFLEICWEALESTGYLPDKYPGKIGVFAGSGSNTYFLNNIHTRPDITARLGHFQISTLNDKDYLAMRIAYELDLKGPAVSVYSSSSTSLLAIAQAVESIRQGQCDLALAGAVTINSPIRSGHIYEDGAMFSKDGHCRPFDALANGTIFSDGAGVVLLKTLDNAKRDGDTVYAVIKGIGLNNDGGLKASFTAPHAGGQADAINMALTDAGVSPSDITYIEAHGTATPIGDPIEIEGLKIAFGENLSNQYCAIGSLKGNMGHLTHAAGVAGLIKTALALHYKIIPPSLYYDQPNPNIDFTNSPFFVNTELRHWESKGPRLAGVSSFGIGGTNVHVILGENQGDEIKVKHSNKPQLIKWSAKNKSSLNHYGDSLADYLSRYKDIDIADVAYTLQQTRSDFFLRRYIIALDRDDFLKKLQSEISQTDIKILSESASDIAFIFPGQGSQYATMGIELYQKEQVFKNAVDECAVILEGWLGRDIRKILYSSDESGQELNQTRFAQPALFVTEYATARLWISWGIQPAAFAGHSIGEFVAAHLAGIFSLEDVLKVISERARIISRLPEGSMLAIKIPVQDLPALLPAELSIAAINSPNLCVVSGLKDDIENFSKILLAKGITNRTIKTSHAFHSAMMDGAKAEFSTVIASVKLNPPRLPLVSTVSGSWMSEAQATDPEYWINQLRLPVRFADALASLWEDPNRLLLEVGPGNAATIFAKDLAKGTSQIAVHGFGIRDNDRTEYADMLRSLGKIWQNGIVPDWAAVNSGRIIRLPTYAFERKKCWVEPGSGTYTLPEILDDTASVEIDETLASIAQSPRSRKDILIENIKTILENASGIEMRDVGTDLNFIEIGFDSLLLTQIAITLKKEFAIPVSFRQLNEGLNTINRLADHLNEGLPEDTSLSLQNSEAAEIGRQIKDLNQQLSSLNLRPLSLLKNINTEGLSPEEIEELNKPFGAGPKIETQASPLNSSQSAFLKDLIEKYTNKTKSSKKYTQLHRSYMADPRVVSGFRPLTKELIYPIVAKFSKGSLIHDLDDNIYIDALNGFGSNMLGYQPDILVKAIKDQMDKGYEIGPQHELAADVCKLICEFTNFDRAAICSTGSEAVMGTMRIARTVTARSLIVAFSGSYHGIFDEVLVRGTQTFRSVPAAAGIMPEAVENMLILDYGTDETLKIIRERAHELAAVLVEPVQSRRPEFQPVEFLKEVRRITERSGTVLIFDEVITGFRMHPGGTQALFDIKADIASYGKVIGGGLPIGVIAGKREFMDALDGGAWQFGDNSTPEVGVTYFAGTFVRHPLALIAAKTSLEYFKQRGPTLQQELNDKTAWLVDSMTKICLEFHIPVKVVSFGSLWRLKYTEEVPYGDLLFTLMRFKGIHILDGFPCFVTESNTPVELKAISDIFKESIIELIKGGFLLPDADKSVKFVRSDGFDVSPIPGAKLGRDGDGNPAWFIENPEQPGKYMQVKLRG